MTDENFIGKKTQDWQENQKQIDEYFAYLKKIAQDKLYDVQDAKYAYTPIPVEFDSDIQKFTPADIPNLASILADKTFIQFASLSGQRNARYGEKIQAIDAAAPQESNFKKQTNYAVQQAKWSANKVAMESFFADFKTAFDQIFADRLKEDDQYAFQKVELKHDLNGQIFAVTDNDAFNAYESYIKTLTTSDAFDAAEKQLEADKTSAFNAIKSQDTPNKPFFSPMRRDAEVQNYNKALDVAKQFYGGFKTRLDAIKAEKSKADDAHAYQTLVWYIPPHTDKSGKSWGFTSGDENKLDTLLADAQEDVFEWLEKLDYTTLLNDNLSIHQNLKEPVKSDFFLESNWQTAHDAWEKEKQDITSFFLLFPAAVDDIKQKKIDDDNKAAWKPLKGVDLSYFATMFTYEWKCGQSMPDPNELVKLAGGDTQTLDIEITEAKNSKQGILDQLTKDKPEQSAFHFESNYQASLTAWQADYDKISQLRTDVIKNLSDALALAKNPNAGGQTTGGSTSGATNQDQYPWIEIKWEPKAGGKSKSFTAGSPIDHTQLSIFTLDELERFDGEIDGLADQIGRLIHRNEPAPNEYSSEAAYDKAILDWNENTIQNWNFWDEVKRAIALAAKAASGLDASDDAYHWIESEWNFSFGGMSEIYSKDNGVDYEHFAAIFVKSQLERIIEDAKQQKTELTARIADAEPKSVLYTSKESYSTARKEWEKNVRANESFWDIDVLDRLNAALLLYEGVDAGYHWVDVAFETNYNGVIVELNDALTDDEIKRTLRGYDVATLLYIDSQLEPVGRPLLDQIRAQRADSSLPPEVEKKFNAAQTENDMRFNVFYSGLRGFIIEILDSYGADGKGGGTDKPEIPQDELELYRPVEIKWRVSCGNQTRTFTPYSGVDYAYLAELPANFLKTLQLDEERKNYEERINYNRPEADDYRIRTARDPDRAFHFASIMWQENWDENKKFWDETARTALHLALEIQTARDDVGYQWVKIDFTSQTLNKTLYDYTPDTIGAFASCDIKELKAIKSELAESRRNKYQEINAQTCPHSESDKKALFTASVKQNTDLMKAFYDELDSLVDYKIDQKTPGSTSGQGSDGAAPPEPQVTQAEIDAAVEAFRKKLQQERPIFIYSAPYYGGMNFKLGVPIDYFYFSGVLTSQGSRQQAHDSIDREQNDNIQALTRLEPESAAYQSEIIYNAVHTVWEEYLADAKKFWNDLHDAVNLGGEIYDAKVQYRGFYWRPVSWEIDIPGKYQRFNDGDYPPKLAYFESLDIDEMAQAIASVEESRRKLLTRIDDEAKRSERSVRNALSSTQERNRQLIQENIKRVNDFFDKVAIPIIEQARLNNSSKDASLAYKLEPFFVQLYDDFGKTWQFGEGDENKLDVLLKDADVTVFDDLANYEFANIRQKIEGKQPDATAFFSDANYQTAQQEWNHEKDALANFESAFKSNVAAIRANREKEDRQISFEPFGTSFYMWETSLLPGLKYRVANAFPDAQEVADKYDESTLKQARGEFLTASDERIAVANARMPDRADFFLEANYVKVANTWAADYRLLTTFLGDVKDNLDAAIAIKEGATPAQESTSKYQKVEIKWLDSDGALIASSNAPIVIPGDLIDRLDSFDFDDLEGQSETSIKSHEPVRANYVGSAAYKADFELWRENLDECRAFWADVRRAVANAKATSSAINNLGYVWIDNAYSYSYLGATKAYSDLTPPPQQAEFNKKPYNELVEIQKGLSGARQRLESSVEAQHIDSAIVDKSKYLNKKAIGEFFDTIQTRVDTAISYQNQFGKVGATEFKHIQPTIAEWKTGLKEDGVEIVFRSGEKVDYTDLVDFSCQELATCSITLTASRIQDEINLRQNAPIKESDFANYLEYKEALAEWDENYNQNMKFWKETEDAVIIAYKIAEAREEDGSDVDFHDVPTFETLGSSDPQAISSALESQLDGLDIKQIAAKEQLLIQEYSEWSKSMYASYPRPNSYPDQEKYAAAVKEWREKFDAGRRAIESARAKVDETISPIRPDNAEFALVKIDRFRERKYGAAMSTVITRETQRFIGQFKRPMNILYHAVPKAKKLKDAWKKKKDAAHRRGNISEESEWNAKIAQLEQRIDEWVGTESRPGLAKRRDAENLGIAAQRADFSDRINRIRARELLSELFPDQGGVEFFSQGYTDSIKNQSQARGFGEQADEALDFLGQVARCYNTGGRSYREPSRFAFEPKRSRRGYITLGGYSTDTNTLSLTTAFGNQLTSASAAWRYKYHASMVHEHFHNLVNNNLGSNRCNANVEWMKQTFGNSEIKHLKLWSRDVKGVNPKKNVDALWNSYAYRVYDRRAKDPFMPGTDTHYTSEDAITTAAEAIACDPEAFVRGFPKHFELLLDNLRELLYNPNKNASNATP